MNMFKKTHNNDKFLLDDEEVSVERFNEFYDSHNVNGWEEINQLDGSFLYVIYRDEVSK